MAGREELGDGQRAHKEHRFQALNRTARLFDQLSNWEMTAFAFDLASNDAHVSGVAVRLLVQIPGKNFLPRNLNTPRVEIAKLCYMFTSHHSINV